MKPLRVIVIGAGAFGRNHARVLSDLASVELAGIVDQKGERAEAVAKEYRTVALADWSSADAHAAIVATPTSTHEEITRQLLEAGLDVLVEKPIASSSAGGERLQSLAEAQGRILQVGHLERFNPAVQALTAAVRLPLFFEVHRLSVFTPRSLDVDVVLDLMIHDLDIVLQLTRETPHDVQAAGISVLSPRVDIANVRLGFPSGCIANLTASRVSTEQVRKLRLFQPGEYLSVDYGRQDAFRLSVSKGAGGALPEVHSQTLPVEKAEPLRLELESFLACVRKRSQPLVDARAATAALALAERILATIEAHAATVRKTLEARAGQ